MKYTISKEKLLQAQKIFSNSGNGKWTKDLNILLDNNSENWFVIEKPTQQKLNEILKEFTIADKIEIKDIGKTGKDVLDQHFTQFGACYLVFNQKKQLGKDNNIR